MKSIRSLLRIFANQGPVVNSDFFFFANFCRPGRFDGFELVKIEHIYFITLYINDFSANHINYWCWCDLFALEQYVIHVRKIFFNLPHSLLTLQLINFSVVTFLHAQFCPDIFSLLYIHTNLLIKWIFFIITLNKSFNMMKTYTHKHFVCNVHSIFVNSLIIIGFNILLFIQFMMDVFELMQWHCNDFDQPQSSIVIHFFSSSVLSFMWIGCDEVLYNFILSHIYTEQTTVKTKMNRTTTKKKSVD